MIVIEVQKNKEKPMKAPDIDFYSSTNIKSYNLNATMRHQLEVLDSLDVFTRRHCENVANITCRICEYLHCSKSFIIYATINAYLHDVGKMFIPPEILQKPGRLTEEEYEVIKTHTTLGYNLCMKDLDLRPYAVGALYHHEALNGSGYPNGVTKKDIPYAAQIIRVADEYDAIVSKRQYKTHINISEALKILIKDARPDDYIRTVALDHLSADSKLGKISPRILKVLFHVVIDDTLYEISGVDNYIQYLKEQIKRLEMVQKYEIKMNTAKKEKQKAYYRQGMEMLFQPGENFDNYNTLLKEYTAALHLRLDTRKKLYEEIRIIKKLEI